MKKFIALLMVCCALLSFTSNAQPATSLTIKNSTSCQLCFYLLGAKGPECLPITSKTNIICIPPGGVINFPNVAAAPFIPPLSSVGSFSGICFYNYNPSISCPGIPLVNRCVYNRCAGTPQMDTMPVYNSDCKVCGTVKITWTLSGTAATVTIN